MKELCFECKATGECWFEKESKHIAESVKKIPEIRQQQTEAFVALRLIANDRIEARKKGCPNLNNIDPDYPGKNLL